MTTAHVASPALSSRHRAVRDIRNSLQIRELLFDIVFPCVVCAALCASALQAQSALRGNFNTSRLPRSAGTPSDTVTTLTLSSDTISAGTVETLTAAVTYYGYPIAPGVVTFKDGKNEIGTAQLVATEGAPNYGTSTIRMRFGIGTQSISSSYAAADGFDPSTSTAQTLTVTGVHPTTTSIARYGNPDDYTLKAQVVGSGSLLAPTGNVSFFDTTNADYFLTSAPLQNPHTDLSFINKENLPVNIQFSIVTADFNGDGIPDLASAAGENTVAVFLGTGDGTFTGPFTVTGPPYAFDQMAVGDFNDDGIPDLAVTSYVNSDVTILLGNGDGTFATVSQTLSAGLAPTSIAVADFNRDGILDLAMSSLADNVVTVLLGNGDGTFRVGTPATAGTGSISYGLAVGDFNGDGKIDVAVSDSDLGSSVVNSNIVNILLGNGDGTFTLSSKSPATGQNPYGGTVADFNADGNLDLAIPNELDGTVTVLLGKGDGTFNTVPETSATGGTPVQLAVGDFNGDGIPDLAAANFFGNNVAILLGNGDGTFTVDPLSPIPGLGLAAAAVGDFNGDGLSDLAAALQADYSPPKPDPINIFLSRLTVTETAIVTHIAPPGTGTHEVNASYPGDTNYGPSISRVVPLKGALIPTTLTLKAKSASITGRNSVLLTATLSPSSAEAYSTDGEIVTFSRGSSVLGKGTLSMGVATFKVNSLAVGKQTLKASYSGDSRFKAASASLKIVVRNPL